MCAIRQTGELECWGESYNDYLGRELKSWENSFTIPDGRFISVSVHENTSCAVRMDHVLVCWGWDHGEEGNGVELINVDVELVSVETYQFCLLFRNGSIECRETHVGAHRYGYSQERVSPADVTPPGNDFISVTVGDQHACGIRREGSVTCWGDNYNYLCEPQSDSYGMSLGCFLKRGDPIGQAVSPEGRFIAISSDAYHNCGIRPNGLAECWGADFAGQSTPPVGPLTSISAGYAHTCGTRVDGSVQCWGNGLTEFAASTGPIDNMIPDSRSGEDFVLAAPDLPFASISAGDGFTCGIVTDGRLKCWGRITR